MLNDCKDIRVANASIVGMIQKQGLHYWDISAKSNYNLR